MTKKILIMRLVLTLFGILLALLLVEAGLRFGGIILSTAWRLKQRHNIPVEGSYRILCLGESTTWHHWPSLLEEDLNRANSGMTFKIIDAGVPGTCTGAIVSRLDERLDEFHPQMVVTMMGINDWEWIWKDAPEYKDKASIKLLLFLKETRINKLTTYIAGALKNRVRTTGWSASPASENPAEAARKYFEAGEMMRNKGDFKKAEQLFNLAITTDPRYAKPYFFLRDLYHNTGRLEEEEAILKDGIIRVGPDDVPSFHMELMDFYAYTGRIKDAENTFSQAIAAYPANAAFYFRLGNIYHLHSELEKAKAAFSSAIKMDPRNPQYYCSLGWVYNTLGNNEKAESTFQTGIKAIPDNALLYKALADFYQNLKKFDQSESAYKTVIKLSPEELPTYLELGRLYYQNQKFEKAADTLSAAIRIDGTDPWTYFELEKAYRALGKNEKAADIHSQGSALMDGRWAGKNGQRMQSYPPGETIRNYLRLKNRILERNIRLVCMQYPMRRKETLMQTLGNDNRVLYVENMENFSQALKTHPPTDIFNDLFAGDFGHCTQMGDELIAKNLSNIILRDVLNKKEAGDASTTRAIP